MTTVSKIMEHVHKGTIGTVYSLLDGEYELIEAEILDKSELLNKKIKDVDLPKLIRIGAVVRKDKVIIPRSDFTFEKKRFNCFFSEKRTIKRSRKYF